MSVLQEKVRKAQEEDAKVLKTRPILELLIFRCINGPIVPKLLHFLFKIYYSAGFSFARIFWQRRKLLSCLSFLYFGRRSVGNPPLHFKPGLGVSFPGLSSELKKTVSPLNSPSLSLQEKSVQFKCFCVTCPTKHSFTLTQNR